ncbi:hypothetical protein AVEN_121254-1 [Araneus ventricosus]|uniref:Uncharacterized protein n=1 Tax=Araneus ventricosus TaxID=182803 RepID=A0A4Y2KYW9_ARAVE|nr:hypothetical protein AVEN_121254-1 [Araneus ventricosus]
MAARVRKYTRLAGCGLDTAAAGSGRREKTAKNRLCGRTLKYLKQSLSVCGIGMTQRARWMEFGLYAKVVHASEFGCNSSGI